MIFLALVALLLGFSALSSLVQVWRGGPGAGPWLHLGVGLGVTFLLPALLALWLRRRGGQRRRQPSSALMVLLLNLVLVAGLVFAAPEALHGALSRHGHWWVEATVRGFGVEGESAVIDAAKLGALELAALIPGAPAETKAPTSAPTGRPESQPSQPSQPSSAPAKARPVATSTQGATPATRPSPTPGGRASSAEPAPPQPAGTTVYRFNKGQMGILVPVTLVGPAGKADVKMIFDTGASLSTVDSGTLAAIGVRPHAADPQIVAHTANGRARRKLVLLRGASLKGARVSGGLTVAICDPCATKAAGERVVGLLGLNFQRHFAVTVDHDGGTLKLEAKRPDPGVVYDLRHFIDVRRARGSQRGGRFTVEATVHNLSAYPVDKLLLTADFGKTGALSSDPLPRIAPRGKTTLRFTRSLKGRARRFVMRVREGRWAIPR